MAKLGRPLAICTSTSTSAVSRPRKATVRTRAMVREAVEPAMTRSP